MYRSRRALKRSRDLNERIGRREKKPKFLAGEHVYVQKIARGKRVILFGVVQFDREVYVTRWVNSRNSTRRKFKYLVVFDEPIIQIRPGRRNWPRSSRETKVIQAWISEGSLHKLTNEEDVVRKILGNDYL